MHVQPAATGARNSATKARHQQQIPDAPQGRSKTASAGTATPAAHACTASSRRPRRPENCAQELDAEQLIFQIEAYRANANVAFLMSEGDVFERARRSTQGAIDAGRATPPARCPARRPIAPSADVDLFNRFTAGRERAEVGSRSTAVHGFGNTSTAGIAEPRSAAQ